MKINKWVTRSGEIIGGAIKESGTDYTANISQLKEDAKHIRTNVIQASGNAKDVFNKMKNNGGLGKQFNDWFFNKGNQFMDADLNAGDDDEFDSGFHGFDDDTDTVTSKTSKQDSAGNITNINMKQITRGQVGEMYGMFGKMTQSNMANTAEIVSTINTQRSEVIASLNNISGILTTTSKKMDALITVSIDNKPKTEDGLYDSQNRINLGSFSKIFADTIKEHPVFSMGKMLKDMGGTGMMTPEFAVSSAIDFSGIKDKKLGILGDRSIDQFGNEINEAVGNSISDVFSNVIDNDFFKMIFGDLNDSKISKNYAIKSQYNNKAATFDGMARWSIVSIIPEYLKNIHTALSGTTLNVDTESGRLISSGIVKSQFHEVGYEALRSSAMGSTQQRDDLFEEINRPTDDSPGGNILNTNETHYIGMGFSSLNLAFVNWLHDDVRAQTLKMKDINSNNVRVINEAVTLLVAKSGLSTSKCRKIISAIMARLENTDNIQEARAFAVSVKNNLDRLRKSAQEQAKLVTDGSSQLYSSGLRVLTSEAFTSTDNYSSKRRDEQLEKQYEELKKGADKQAIGGKAKKIKNDYEEKLTEFLKLNPTFNEKKAGDKSNVRRVDATTLTHQFTQMDYLKGIFDRLNIGINTRVVNVTKKGKLYMSKYDPITLTPTDIIDKAVYPEDSQFRDSYGSDDDTKTDEKKESVPITEQLHNMLILPFKNAFANLIPKEFIDLSKSVIDKTGIQDKMGDIKERITDMDISKKIFGKKGADGAKTEEGLVDRIGGKLGMFRDDAFDTIKQKSSEAFDVAMGYGAKHEKVNMDKIEDLKKDANANDQEKITMATSMMQGSITSGTTSDDYGSIMEVIDSIGDENIARHMKKTMGGMLRRNDKKDAKKGIFGKLISGLGAGLKFAFTGVLKPVIRVLTTISSGIFKLFSLWAKMFKGGAKMMGSGVKDVAGALFGKSEKVAGKHGATRVDKKGNVLDTYDAGDVTREKESGILQDTTSKLGLFNKKDKDESPTKPESVSTTTDDKGVDTTSQKEKRGLLDLLKDNLKIEMPGIFDGLKDTSFGKGFMSVFGKGKIISKVPESFGDTQLEKQTDILGDIKSTIFDIVDIVTGKTKKKDDKTDVSGVGPTADDQQKTSGTGENKTPITGKEGMGKTGATAYLKTPTAPKQTTANATTVRAPDKGGGGGLLGGGKGDMLSKIGSAVGGIAKILGGFGQMIMSVVMSLASVQTLMKLVQETMVTIVAPLEGLFKVIVKGIQPILEVIGETIAGIVAPILEALMPVVTSIFDVIKPLLDVVTGLVNMIMIPIMVVLETVIVPVLRGIGNSLQYTMGILQIGFGIIQVALGGILAAIGTIVKRLTFGLVDGMADSGVQMMKDGAQMAIDGGKTVAEAVINHIKLVGEMVGIIKPAEEETPVDIEYTPEKRDVNLSDIGMTGSGDVYNNTYNTYNNTNSNNTNTNNNSNANSTSDVYNTYGSGDEMNQKAFGNYLNMKDRGCGPSVLADLYNRRLYGSGPVNGAQMASAMYRNGEYEPDRGTSFGNMINAGNRMGLGLRPGGVTNNSLRYASPNNPVTVIGSGSAFNTRRGNNHYVNVVGTSGGTAYVANPLTGRTSRQSLSSVVSGSRMGLYGSGDIKPKYEFNDMYGSGDDLFKFSDETKSKFKELTDITGNILKIFSFGEDGIESEIKKQRDAANEQELSRNIELLLEQYKDLSRAQRAQVDILAIYLWWKEEVPEDDDQLRQLFGIWNKPPECQSPNNTPYPDQEAYREAIEKVFTTKGNKIKRSDLFKSGTTPDYNYWKAVEAYRTLFVDRNRYIDGTAYKETTKVKKGSITPRIAFNTLLSEDERNIQLGKATGLFVAGDRKYSSEMKILEQRLTESDMSSQNEDAEKAIINPCPACGRDIGSNKDCPTCQLYAGKKEELGLDGSNPGGGSNGSGGAGAGVLGLKKADSPVHKQLTGPWNPITDHPLRHFFKKTGGPSSITSWYHGRQEPDGYGEGQRFSAFQGVRPHNGVDFSSGSDNLIATTDGKVVDVVKGYAPNTGSSGSSQGGGFGNHVIWEDTTSGKYEHVYAHLNAVDPSIKVGANVIGGETRIGAMGHTGSSTGKHLHYGVSKQRKSNWVNPFRHFRYFMDDDQNDTIYQPDENPGGDNSGNGNNTGSGGFALPGKNWPVFNQVVNKLKTAGFNNNNIAGVMGNLSVESGGAGYSDLNPTATGDGGKAHGIVQWHNKITGADRYGALKKRGDVNSVDNQVGFMIDEMTGNDSSGGQWGPKSRIPIMGWPSSGWSKEKSATRFKLWRSLALPDESADVFDSAFERSSGAAAAKRQELARGYFDKLNTASNWSGVTGSGDLGIIPNHEIPQIPNIDMGQQMVNNNQQPLNINIDGVVAEMRIDQLERVLKNQYNVQDKETHRILSLILKKLDDHKSGNNSPATSPGQSQSMSLHNMFSDEIPKEYTSILT